MRLNCHQRCLPWLLVIGIFAAQVARAEDFEFFEQRIRPIFTESCYQCHSVQSEKVKGGLRLDTREGLLKGGENGPSIVPGDPENSLLIKAVRYTDKDLQMPPKDKKLTEAQIADLVTWVKMGAPDPRSSNAANERDEKPKPAYDFAEARKHWAFHSPLDPAIPVVRDQHWAKSAIDNFVLEKLEEKNLSPALSADKRTLIRRATFDLTGLPPTPEEVEAFMKDELPDAFAKLVDRLLASPHYGERWGRHWLDVVRYTDSLDSRVVGQESDIIDSYRYRDWVVNAFNNDLPYDQFIKQQIAGDILQPGQPEKIDTNALIATGMYAIGNWGNGDADKDKILTDIADDQVDVTGRAFLGLTLACARCHDHKFDPIPTADYYSMAGIFFSSHILAKLAPKGSGETVMRVPLASKSELEWRKKREEQIAQLEKKIQTKKESELGEFARSLLPTTKDYLVAAARYKNRSANRSGLNVEETNKLDAAVLQQWVNYLGFGDFKLLSKPVKNLLDKPGLHALRNARNADTPSAVANNTDREVSFLSIKMPAHSLAIHPSPKAGVAVGWKSPITGIVRLKGKVADADPSCGDGIEWTIKLKKSGGVTSLANGAIANGGMQPFSEGKGAEKLMAVNVQPGEMIEVAVLPKGEYSCDTTLVELEIGAEGAEIWNVVKDVVPDFENGENPHRDQYGNKGVWHFYDMDGQAAFGEVVKDSPFAKWLESVNRQASDREIRDAAEMVQQALLAPDGMSSTLSKLYRDLTDIHSAFWAGTSESLLSKEVEKLQGELKALKENPPAALAMAHALQEGGVPESPHAGIHDVKIHIRGRYDRLGETVPRRFPRLLAGDEQKPITEGSGRLQLADWIVSPTNPLTARVMVNRIWQHHFGEGIVRTPNNFGKLGIPPTHPELLDYLAHRFVESGWSIKAMHRAIMLSAAYQQSSVPDPATLKADPDNLLFGRMNRRRLESEAIRDSLLAVAGKIDLTMGGPAIRDLNTLRRTLYVMTIRSDRATYQFLFDAADPNAIVEKRIDSTVAPQSLFLMNHPFVLAQTKALVERLNKEAPKEKSERIKWLYQLLYGREPSLEEVRIGERALAQARVESKDNQADELNVAAWEEYCQVLLCANEFMYVD
jgi:mono/diheme cytochrome c family protein